MIGWVRNVYIAVQKANQKAKAAKSPPPKPDMKVRFQMEINGQECSETLWATTVGNGQYRLENSPFLAYNVSLEDVVHAVP